jgi:ATP synthase protein I
MSGSDPKQNPWKALFLASVIGIDFAFCMLIGYWIGQWLARLGGGSPLLFLAGLLFGLFLGGVSIYLLVKPFKEG